jgi:hypothetical protein
VRNARHFFFRTAHEVSEGRCNASAFFVRGSFVVLLTVGDFARPHPTLPHFSLVAFEAGPHNEANLET